jgi:alanine racemase
MRAGVLPIGYGDGFDRRMSEGGEVLVGDTPCSVLGLVSMDLTIIDLTPVPQAQSGDEVTLIGPGLDAQVMADRCGTVAYEVLCGIGKRVPRVYCD